MTARRKLPFSKTAGFTLIELLVVTAIIGILTTVAIASFNSFNRSQSIKLGALGLQSQLRAQKNFAIAGKKDASCRIDNVINDSHSTAGQDNLDDYALIGYYTTFTVGSNMADIGQDCSPNFLDPSGNELDDQLQATASKRLPEDAQVKQIIPYQNGVPCAGATLSTNGNQATVEFYSVNADPNTNVLRPFDKDLVGYFLGPMDINHNIWAPAGCTIDSVGIVIQTAQTATNYKVTVKANGDVSQEKF